MGGFSPHSKKGENLMFFAYIITILIILGFLYLIWLKVIKPLLEGHGIEVDEEKPIETDHTKQLEKLKNEFEELSASAKAAKDGLALAKKIKQLEQQIIDADSERKKL